MTAVTKPIFSNEPSRLNWPRIPRSGVLVIDSGSFGTVRAHADGLVRAPLSSKTRGPMWKIASRTIASDGRRDDADEDRALDLADEQDRDEEDTDDEDERRPPVEAAADAELARHRAGVVGRRAKPASMTPM